MNTHIRRTFAIAVVSATVVAGTTAIALSSSQEIDESPAARGGPGGPTATVPEAVLDQVSAFRASRAGEDDLGAASKGLSNTPLVPQFGLAIDKAHRAQAPRGSKAWIAPSSDGVCLLVLPKGADGVGGGCAPVAEVTAGTQLVTVAGSRNDVEIFGVVPDGVSTVELILDDGSSQTLRVKGNSYAVAVDQPTVAVEFDGPAGRQRVDARSYKG